MYINEIYGGWGIEKGVGIGVGVGRGYELNPT